MTAIAGLTAAGIALYKNWDTVKEKMGAAWDWIKEKGQGFADWFKALPEEMVNMVLGLPAKLAEAMGALGNWVKAKLKDMFTIDISFGNVFSGKDGKTASDEIFAAAFGTVGGSATGGRFTQPALSLIGEGDSPEYVIPTRGRYKNNGLALWRQAGRDLGVPMYAAGAEPAKGAKASLASFWSSARASFADAFTNGSMIWPLTSALAASLGAISPSLALAGLGESLALMGGGVITGLKGLFSSDNSTFQNAPQGDIIKSASESKTCNYNFTFAPRVSVQSGDDMQKAVEDAVSGLYEDFVRKMKEFVREEKRLAFA